MEELSEMTTIKLRRASAAGNAPSSLVAGEIAISEFDGLEYRRDPSGAVYAVNVSPLQPEGNLIIDSLYNNAAGNKFADGGDSSPLVSGIVAGNNGQQPTLGSWANVSGPVVCSYQRVTDAPSGFDYSLKLAVTTADATMGADDSAGIVHFMRPTKSFMSKLRWGGANAKPLRLGFWIKAKRTGTYGVSMQHYLGSTIRSFVAAITINQADTWEYKNVSISGDTGSNVGIYAEIRIQASVGSTNQTTAGAWTAGWFAGTSAQTNGVAATSDYFQVAGMSLHIGTYAPTAALSRYLHRTPFEDQLYLAETNRIHGLNYQGNVTFYYDPTNGSDLNSGLHPDAAFQTLQAVADRLQYIDCGGGGVIVQFVAGSNAARLWNPEGAGYATGMYITKKPANCKYIKLLGTTAAPENTTVTVAALTGGATTLYYVYDVSGDITVPIIFDGISFESSLSLATYWTVMAASYYQASFEFDNVRFNGYYTAALISHGKIQCNAGKSLTIYGNPFVNLFTVYEHSTFIFAGTLNRGITMNNNQAFLQAAQLCWVNLTSGSSYSGGNWNPVFSTHATNLCSVITAGKTPGSSNFSIRGVLDNVWT
jgi:hypothetical protein